MIRTRHFHEDGLMQQKNYFYKAKLKIMDHPKDFPPFTNICITNLACNELIMKILQSSFIHRFVHFTHEYHALKTQLTHK
jgi:hypothetical protein